MMLLTFSGRPTLVDEFGGRWPIAWKRFVKPRDLELGIHIPADWQKMSEKEFSDWPINQGYDTRQTIIWRGLLTPKQWRRYITGCRAHMRNLWKTRWGRQWDYVEVMEFHESGVPHLHYCYRQTPGMALSELQKWLEITWGKIVNETRYTPIVGCGQNFRDHTAEGGLNYCLKYITKDLNVKLGIAKRDRAVLHAILGLKDEEPAINWNHAIRKITVSNSWPRAKAGDLDKFTTMDPETGETGVYNRTMRERAYGRMYRVVTTAEYREAVIDGEDGADVILSEQPIWAPVGPRDRFGYPTWRNIGKRPGMTAEKANKAILDWMVIWEPVIDNQLLQAEYYNHGEKWERNGMEWKAPDDPYYWERVYQMPDGSIEPIQ